MSRFIYFIPPKKERKPEHSDCLYHRPYQKLSKHEHREKTFEAPTRYLPVSIHTPFTDTRTNTQHAHTTVKKEKCWQVASWQRRSDLKLWLDRNLHGLFFGERLGGGEFESALGYVAWIGESTRSSTDQQLEVGQFKELAERNANRACIVARLGVSDVSGGFQKHSLSLPPCALFELPWLKLGFVLPFCMRVAKCEGIITLYVEEKKKCCSIMQQMSEIGLLLLWYK